MPTFLQIVDLPAGAFEDKGWLPVKSISNSITTEIGKYEQPGKARNIPYSEAGDIEVKRMFDRALLYLQIALCRRRIAQRRESRFQPRG